MPASGKSLPEYEDVFTEIVNTLLFHSVPVVRESRLHPFPEDPAVGLFNPFKEGQFTCSRIMIRERPPRRTGFFRLVWTAAIDPEISFHVYDCFALDNTLQYDHNCEVELIREEMAKRGVSHPTTEQLLAATPEQIRNLSRNELRTLTQEQMNALTDAQYQALSEEQRKVLDDVEEWNFHAITPVLYFGKERWEKVRSSAELWMEQLTDIDSPLALAPMQQNARAAVYDISHLPPETLERFHTDFRFVAEYFVCRANGQPCTLPRDDQLRHPEAFRTMMYQLTEDPQFLPA